MSARDSELKARFAQIEPGLLRYPAIDPPQFKQKLEDFLSSHDRHNEKRG